MSAALTKTNLGNLQGVVNQLQQGGPARKIEELRLELIRADIVARDEEHAPYEVGPPISPLHS